MTSLLAAILIAQCPPGAAYCPRPTVRPLPAALTPDERWFRQTVRVIVPFDRSTGYGSGTIVVAEPGKNALVVTAKHVVKGAKGKIVAQHSSGLYEAKTVAIDPGSDLAALVISTPPGVKSINLASSHPGRALMVGYGETGKYHTHEGTYHGEFDNWKSEFAMGIHEGDSGAGIFSEPDGRFAGVAIGYTEPGESVAVSTVTLTSFLKQTCFRLFRRTPQPSPYPINVQAPGVGVNIGGGSPVTMVPSTPVVVAPAQPVVVQPVEPAPVVIQPAPVVTQPVPVQPVQTVDLSGILQRLATLESQMSNVATVLQQHSATLQTHTQQLAQGITFVTPQPDGSSTSQNVHLGESIGFKIPQANPRPPTPQPPTK